MRRAVLHFLVVSAALLGLTGTSAAWDDPSGSAPAFPKLLSAKVGGHFTRATAERPDPFRILSEAPKSSETPRFTLRLDAVPAIVAVKLERRNEHGTFVALTSKAKITAETTTVLLKPSGSWNRKRLSAGTYRVTFMTPDPPTKTALFAIH